MKNYEEMAHSVLKRRDTEIKRRKRAFLIGAPCAAAVLVGVVGVSAAAASRGRSGYINPVVGKPDSGSSANSSAPAAPAFSTTAGKDTVGTDTSGTNAIGYESSADIGSSEYIEPIPPYTQGGGYDAPDSSGTGIRICSGVPVVPPVPNDPAPTSTAEVTTVDIGIDLPVDNDPLADDYTNPNAGQNDIKILDIDEFSFPEITVELDENDFDEYTLEALDGYYHLRFNRLEQLYPSWTLSHDRLGVYRHEENDGFIASLKIVSSLNTLTYNAPDVTVRVSAQHNEFTPVSKERLSKYKPVENAAPKPETHIEYDENGNVIGMSTGAYDPGDVKVVPDEGASIVNGYEALIYRSADGSYLADLDMASDVRITAEGLTEEQFLEVLDNFTR